MLYLLLSTLALTSALTLNLPSPLTNPPPHHNLTLPRPWPPTPYTIPLEPPLSLTITTYGPFIPRTRKTEIVRSIRDIERAIRDLGELEAVFVPQYIGRGRVGMRFWGVEGVEGRVLREGGERVVVKEGVVVTRGQVARVCEALGVVVGILGPRGIEGAEIGVEGGVGMGFEMVVA